MNASSLPRPMLPWFDRLHNLSIRKRLLLAYVGLLLVGFLALTLVAGGQIAQAARADYEQRLLNEVHLLSQGLSAALPNHDQDWTEENQAALNALIAEYETQLNGTVAVYNLDGDRGGSPPGREGFRDAPEMETAIRDGVGRGRARG
ncbi:MAG: hypothetical protein IPK19_05340 [Chloroflexi bacterium]|nr:hypothetical protein [Chloroflexota bacterium]